MIKSPTPDPFYDAIIQSGQPMVALKALAAAYRDVVGFGMMTILLYDIAKGRGRRIYSSSQKTHPTGVYKDIPATDWVDLVLVRQRCFIADTVAEFKPHYSDWALLQSMGLVSGVNFPVVVDGQTIGSVNLTADREAYYTAERVAAADPLRLATVTTLLLQERRERTTSNDGVASVDCN